MIINTTRTNRKAAHMSYYDAALDDPYFSSVVLLVEGSAVDKSMYGGGFRSNSAKNLFNDGEAVVSGSNPLVLATATADRLKLVGDFTIEFESMLDLSIAAPGNPEYANVCGSIPSVNNNDNAAWIYYYVAGTGDSKNRIAIRRFDTATVIGTTDAPNPDGVFQNFAITRQGATCRIYRDGTIAGLSTGDTDPLNFNGDQSQFGLGKSSYNLLGYNVHIRRMRITAGVARYTDDSYEVKQTWYPLREAAIDPHYFDTVLLYDAKQTWYPLRETEIDPYYFDTVLLLEESPFDKSPQKLIVDRVSATNGLRGAWFKTNNGVSDRNINGQAYWKIRDPDGVLNLSGDFTVELSGYIHPVAGGSSFATLFAGNQWNNAPREIAWIYIYGPEAGPYQLALRRTTMPPVISRAGSQYSFASLNEICIQRKDGVLKMYVNGTCSDSVAVDSETFNFSNGSDRLAVIGNTVAWTSGLHEAAIKRLRVTRGVARYPYDSYKVPDKYWPVVEDPQYVMVHGSLGTANWNFYNPGSIDYASNVADFLSEVGTQGNSRRALAHCITFSLFQYTPAQIKAVMEQMITYSEANNLPVAFKLDLQNYWDATGLWNWFDNTNNLIRLPSDTAPNGYLDVPASELYNPAHIENVEKFDWDSDSYAVKICWRNWGQQHRVKPAPNLAASAFRSLGRAALDAVLPTLASWYRSLPVDKKWLFAGVCVGWENSVWTNAAHFDGGNALWERNKTWAYNTLIGNNWATDPLVDPPWFAGLQNSQDHWRALGYAAAKTMGIKSSGLMDTTTVVAICKDYLEWMADAVIAHGIPQAKISTHAFWYDSKCIGGAGGDAGPAAIVSQQGVAPGWTANGSGLGFVDTLMDTTWQGRPWAAAESYAGSTTNPDDPGNSTVGAISNILSKRYCKLHNLYNWSAIWPFPDRLEALRRILTDFDGTV